MKKRNIFSIVLVFVLCLTVMLSVMGCEGKNKKPDDKKPVEPVEEALKPAAAAKLVYNGNAQALLEVPEGLKCLFSESEDGEFTDKIPEKKDAGKYKIWWKPSAGGEAKAIDCAIAKANIEFKKKPAAIPGLIVSDAEQAIMEAGEAEGREIFYRFGPKPDKKEDLDNWLKIEGWSKEALKAKEQGYHEVWYQVAGDANHKDILTSFECFIRPSGDVLVVGYNRFSQKFSPYFGKTAYDMDVASMTQVGLLTTDRQGAVVHKGKTGETRSLGEGESAPKHDYHGIADLTVTMPTDADSNVYYDFEIRDDIKFSDGSPLTIDDIIFSMYVLSDPAYDGSSSFYTLPIKGMKFYREGYSTRTDLILAMGDKFVDGGPVTEEEYNEFQKAVPAAGEEFVKGIYACMRNTYGYPAGMKVADYMIDWGFKLDAAATEKDAWDAILKQYNNDLEAADAEQGELSIFEAIDAQLGDRAEHFKQGVVTDDSVENITGIERIDDTHLRITMFKFDAVSIYQLGVSVTPLKWYGDPAKYDYANNKFGFVKGDLSGVRAKTTHPMGAGPYIFKEYKNGVVAFEANPHYYMGMPKIGTILFKETTDADKVAGIVAGTFDISDPSINKSAVDAIKKANADTKGLKGNTLDTNLVDNLGYGYAGINADKVKVGKDSGSEQSKALRKALATILASQRQIAIDSYYGDRAAVIQYPISNTNWAAPQSTDEGYALAYSKNAAGELAIKADMKQDAIDEAAKAAALSWLEKAGYTAADGKVTKAPDGAKLQYTVIIPGDGKGDHPAFAVVTNARKLLGEIGIDLVIDDPTDSNVLWDALESGSQELWCAAWQATPDPDMYQIYHSSNIVGKGGTDSNHYHITDADLDKWIMDARSIDDQPTRKGIYKKCLDRILDWGVEIPIYQRKNAVVFSSQRVNLDTLPEDITTFYGWMAEIEKLEMK